MSLRWLWWIGAAALVCCALPWASNPGAGLTLNPVDLAEWTALHPAVQNQQPPLLTTFLLRTPLLIAALLFALAVAGHERRWWAAVPILLLAVGQLPPFEFLSDSGNVNYRQQLLMAVLTLILPLIVLWRVHAQHARIAAVTALFAGLAVAIAGAVSALGEMRAFGLPAQPGIGLVLYSLLLAGSAALLAFAGGIKKRHPETPPSVPA